MLLVADFLFFYLLGLIGSNKLVLKTTWVQRKPQRGSKKKTFFFASLDFFPFGFEQMRRPSLGFGAVAALEVIVVFEPMEYVWPCDIVWCHEYYSGESCAYAKGLPDPLLERFGTRSIQTLDVFAQLLPPPQLRTAPRAGKRFLIGGSAKPPRRAHSQRSPISTQSHHEIGLQTGKCFIFSLQLTLIRRIPGPSGHIALFTLPCSFFMFALNDCLPACFFLLVFLPTPYQWNCFQRSYNLADLWCDPTAD